MVKALQQQLSKFNWSNYILSLLIAMSVTLQFHKVMFLRHLNYEQLLLELLEYIGIFKSADLYLLILLMILVAARG